MWINSNCGCIDIYRHMFMCMFIIRCIRTSMCMFTILFTCILKLMYVFMLVYMYLYVNLISKYLLGACLRPLTRHYSSCNPPQIQETKHRSGCRSPANMPIFFALTQHASRQVKPLCPPNRFHSAAKRPLCPSDTRNENAKKNQKKEG